MVAPAGSPPRAWGQCARADPATPRRLVHPHGRGDNVQAPNDGDVADGSPPRAWGQ